MEATPNLTARKKLLGPYSLRALAGRAGISPSYFSRVLSGKRRPLMETVHMLARARGMGLDEFYVLLTRTPVYAPPAPSARTRRVVKAKKRGARAR
jgi:transcriptional regulator with XRE-family HTH domain